MPRCKAPEILRSEAYIECTLQRRGMRETQQMGVFQRPAKEKTMPRVKMTRTTKIALYCLRFYLVFLLILVIIKFLKVV
jgi:hypothetical protein